MIVYRVMSTEEPIIYYHGQFFKHASLIFDQMTGSRTMERYIDGAWSAVMSYHKGDNK